MSDTATILPSGSLKRHAGRTIQILPNQPDPRPVTDYDVAYAEVGGNSRITITLRQPCVIRGPKWMFIDVANGNLVSATNVTVLSNTAIQFDFTGIIAASVAFVSVPYQDTQVQNFQGGFVRSGGQWFRAPK